MGTISIFSVVFEDGTRVFRPTKATARREYELAERSFFEQVEAGQPAVRPTGIDRHEFPSLTKDTLCRIFSSPDPVGQMIREARTSILSKV